MSLRLHVPPRANLSSVLTWNEVPAKPVGVGCAVEGAVGNSNRSRGLRVGPDVVYHKKTQEIHGTPGMRGDPITPVATLSDSKSVAGTSSLAA